MNKQKKIQLAVREGLFMIGWRNFYLE